MNFDYIINWHYKNIKDCYFISLGIVIEASARTVETVSQYQVTDNYQWIPRRMNLEDQSIKQNINRISLHQFIYHLFERLFYQSVDIRISGMILLQVIPSILLVEEY